MAYGTPANPDGIEAYYTHVRRGRPPTPDLVAELRGRYEAIGGVSPLLERTRAQADGIANALGDGWRVELGMKHAPPFIEDGMAALAAAGVDEPGVDEPGVDEPGVDEPGVDDVVGLVLAPHYSALSIGEYEERARKAAAGSGRDLQVTMVQSWYAEPAYVGLLAGFVADAVARLGVRPVHVLFTAHSLPVRILETGDPYADQLAATAAAVAEAASLDRWSVAWQSAGRTPEPWIGPDVLAVLPELAKAGMAGVVVCPCGFTSDHLEVLYDLDIEATRTAGALGLAFTRTAMPNDHPALCSMLADVVRDRRLG